MKDELKKEIAGYQPKNPNYKHDNELTVKHAPGPWKIKKLLSGTYFILTTNGRKDPVAGVSGFYEGIFNANLIAAAPELLEVCKRAYHVFDVNSERQQELIEQIGKAIAKAEGGEQ